MAKRAGGRGPVPISLKRVKLAICSAFFARFAYRNHGKDEVPGSIPGVGST